jgi:hypothetical protein
VAINGVDIFDVNHFRIERSPVADKLGFVVPKGVGSGKLKVTNAAGSGLSAATLNVVLGVDGVTPGHGVPGNGIDIQGFGFTGASDVSVGSKRAAFTVLSSTKIHATVPATDRGGVAVTVHGHTASGDFYRVTPPTIHRFTKSAAVGERVFIWGNLLYTAGSINGVDLGTFEDEGYRFSFVVPNGAHTGHIKAENAAGTTLSDDILKVSPTVVDFTPSSGPPGTLVTIHGTSFLGATTVKVGSDQAAFTVVNDSTITATVPERRGAGKIQVVTGTGDSSAWGKSSTNFTVTGLAAALGL